MISICIPSYKHVSLTHEAAKSILCQNIDYELVILDDFYLVEKTVKNLYEIESLRDYLYADKRVKCFSNEKLLPIQDNWNKAVSLCTRTYVKLIGADDKLLPDAIAKMEVMISEQPKVEFHGHLANIIDSSGTFIREQRTYGKNFINRTITGAEALKGKLRQQVRFKEPACNFYHKRAWEKVGGYDKKFRFTFDVHFNSIMMSETTCMLWNEYLVELRRHQESDGAQLPASLAIADLKELVAEIFELIGSDLTILDRAAATGWVQYRIVELMAQRIKHQPAGIENLLVNNLVLFVKNPLALCYMTSLLINHGMYGDVQRH